MLIQTALGASILRQAVIPRNRPSAVWPIANALKCNPNPKSQSTIRAQLPVEGGRWQRKSFDCKFTELYSVFLPRLSMALLPLREDENSLVGYFAPLRQTLIDNNYP